MEVSKIDELLYSSSSSSAFAMPSSTPHKAAGAATAAAALTTTPFVGYVYKLGAEASQSWLPLEFISSGDMDTSRFLPVLYHAGLVAEARSVLKHYNATDKLGLTVYHRAHIGTPGSQRLETTDFASRSQAVQEESLVELLVANSSACVAPVQVVFNFGSSSASIGDDWCGVCSN